MAVDTVVVVTARQFLTAEGVLVPAGRRIALPVAVLQNAIAEALPAKQGFIDKVVRKGKGSQKGA